MIIKQELLDAIQLSINMYEGKHGEVKEVLTEKVFEKVNGFPLCTGWKGKNFYIAFEGTSSTGEWVENFNIYKEKIEYNISEYDSNFVKVALGFLNDYRMLRTVVHDRIKENLNIIKVYHSTIYITGHSKGAAVAVLCADDIFKNLYIVNPIKVITFGGPRVFNVFGSIDFNSNFKKDTEREHCRVVCGIDIVPKVPTTWLGFKHCGDRLWLDKPSFINFIKHPIDSFQGIWEDHEPEKEYLKEIEKIKE